MSGEVVSKGGRRLRRQHPDELELIKLAGIVHTIDDLVDGVCRAVSAELKMTPLWRRTEGLRDKTVGGRLGSCVGTRVRTTVDIRKSISLPGARPVKKFICGVPGQLLRATAPANAMKSPGVTPCLATNGFCRLTISSRPMLGWNPVSMESKSMMDPSAPPPL